MADVKIKSRDGGGSKRKHTSSKTLNKSKRKKENEERRKRTGPRLPNALRKEIELMNPKKRPNSSDDDEDVNSHEGNDLYEYEEGIPEEESGKNRRYDTVDNFEYEAVEIEDEDVSSDDYDDDVDDEEEDDEAHAKVLQEFTGLPSDAFEGKKRKNVVVSEAYPESEFNPTRDILDGDGRISIGDLLDPIQGKSGFSKLRKTIDRVEKKSMPVQAPLPKVDRDRLDRKVTHEFTKKDITKWEPMVKKNREAPTLYLGKEVNLEVSTVNAIASKFEPRTEFEKQIASLVNDGEVVEAHNNDGARLLELNKVSIEDVKDRQNRLAKMRTLLFRHELKAKRIKKIKSKTYHRLLKKDRLKSLAAEMGMDPEAAKELAMKQEFKRAEERLRLKHKNQSKWAKRILERGLDVQDEGTRAAFSQQLHQHSELTRKMHSMREGSSSSDDSSDEDDEDEDGFSEKDASKLLERAKEKTIKVLEDDEEGGPKSGVLSLPFMVRGLKKKKEAADEEAISALEKYDSSLRQLDDKMTAANGKTVATSGRRVFGASKNQVKESKSKEAKVDNYYGSSDDEEKLEAETLDVGPGKSNSLQEDVSIDPDLLREESQIGHDQLFKSFDDIVENPGNKTTYDVAIFASDSWKKMPKKDSKQDKTEEKVKSKKNRSSKPKTEKELKLKKNRSSKHGKKSMDDEDSEEVLEDGAGSDSETEMVDGMLVPDTESTYELPSQAELIRRAFAGDDVEADFEKDKEDVLNEENPEPEKPVLLPGWGQWTNVQKKKGLPSWMLKEHEDAKKKREAILKKRKDAHLKRVIISEKVDKKAEKLHAQKLPFPFTSPEMHAISLRLPIGPDYNPVTTVAALNRPDVVKKAGVIIEPIKYRQVNPHERADERKRGGTRQKTEKKGKSDR